MTIDRWNAASNRFAQLKVPAWDNDPFLQFIRDLPVWDCGSNVLDIGCGAGRYSFAISEHCASVLGTDFSPDMIRNAKDKLELSPDPNISFVEEDWNRIDLETRGYQKAFDFVFAHRTPAIAEESGFRKMLDCCKVAGALAGFASFEDSLEQYFCEIHGLDYQKRSSNLPEYFGRLCENGLLPEVIYYTEDYVMEKTIAEERIDLIEILSVKGMPFASASDKAEKFISEHGQNGIITHKGKRTGYAMKWLMNKR